MGTSRVHRPVSHYAHIRKMSRIAQQKNSRMPQSDGTFTSLLALPIPIAAKTKWLIPFPGVETSAMIGAGSTSKSTARDHRPCSAPS